MAMDNKEKVKIQKAAGIAVKHDDEEVHDKHEKAEDTILRKIHKHVKHGLAMGDHEAATSSLKEIDKLIKDMDVMQKDIEGKHEEKKPEEKKPEEKK